MIKEPKPYQIAEICYNAEWPDMPWYVVRSGTVPEQGGFNLGTETVSFASIENACDYLKEMIAKDLETIKKVIKDKKD